jgi:hypothetical protein
LEIDETLVSATLKLQENNEYYFEITMSKEDIIISNLISYGTYTIRGKIIVFEDKNHNYIFSYKNKENYLVGNVTKPFFNLEKIQLKKWSEKYNLTEWIQEDIISIKRQKNYDTNSVFQPYSYGIYTEPIMQLELILRENNTYSYSIGGYRLSEGTFHRNNNTNELIIYDKNMNHYFYVFITESGLIDSIGTYSVELKNNNISAN